MQAFPGRSVLHPDFARQGHVNLLIGYLPNSPEKRGRQSFTRSRPSVSLQGVELVHRFHLMLPVWPSGFFHQYGFHMEGPGPFGCFVNFVFLMWLRKMFKSMISLSSWFSISMVIPTWNSAV